MADHKGDNTKRISGCVDGRIGGSAHIVGKLCPMIKSVYEGWDSETWECAVCGEYYHLYYEDMA